MHSKTVIIVLFSIVYLASCQEVAINSKLQINSATRDLDLSSQLVKQTVEYEILNGDSSPVDYFVVAVDPDHAKHVAYVEAKSGENTLKTVKANAKGLSADSAYKVSLVSPLAAGKSVKVSVQTVISRVLTPFPSHIVQSESQFVQYEGNVHVLSPYLIKKEKTTVKVNSAKINSFTKEPSPANKDGDTITYGPYENVPALSAVPLKLHFENVAPFLVVNQVTRVIEVSHWGNIAVEETVEMEHKGAILKGSFSRFDYQRDDRVRKDKMPSVASFKTVLPASAKDVYYRDEIGNISTSNLKQMDDSVEMEIRPRFPLFGGWKTNYYIGYNLPSYEYLFASGNDFALKMRLIDHIYDNFVVNELTIKIILPEGAKNVKLTPPYPVRRSADEMHYTYLDMSGRPVIIAHKNNLVENHIQDFELDYTFDRMTMLREPLMVIVAFYLMFLVVIIWVRLDFTISSDPVSESRMKVAGNVEKVVDLHAHRMTAYDNWIEAVNKYKSNKDNAALAQAKKKAENELKQISQKITDLQAIIKEDSADTAEKINELQKVDKLAKDQLANLTSNAERLVGGKLPKAAFGDAEKAFKTKMDEYRDKMDNLAFQL